MNVACIVLAAGEGRRMGRPKALLPIGDTTFLARVVATARAAGCARVVAVLRDASVACDAEIVVNLRPEDGQLSSLKLGLRAAAGCEAAFAWPVDHPAVRVETVRRVLAAARPGRIVVPTFEGRGGHPTLFPRELFGELLALPETDGARALLAQRPDAVDRLPVDDAGVCRDVDSPEDYAKLERTNPS